MKITYVLPVYNQQNTIADCIRSILNQEHKDFELIIIDDASTDATPEIMTALKLKEKDNIRLITNKERKGAAWCRNLGNRKAKGEIIAVCDADIYYSNRGEAIADFFEANKDLDVFCSALDLRQSTHPPHITERMDAIYWDFKSKCPVSHPTVAYRKKVSDQVKYKEISIETDLYEFFLINAHNAGFKMNGCQDPLMCKIENNSNRDKSEAKKLKQKMYNQYDIEVEL